MTMDDVKIIKRTPLNENSSVTVSVSFRQPYTFDRPQISEEYYCKFYMYYIIDILTRA